MNNKQKALRFILFTYFFNYTLGGMYLYLNYHTELLKQYRFLPLLTLILYMLIPSIVSIALIKVSFKEKLKDYGFTFKFNRWWFLAWILPYCITVVTIFVCISLGWGQFDPLFTEFIRNLKAKATSQQYEMARHQLEAIPLSLQYIAMIFQTLVAGSTINAFVAFGEEMGWRGLLFTVFQPLGFWRANVLIGIIWGFWHAPIILSGYNFPSHPVLGVFVMTGGSIALAILIGFVRLKSGSVVAASMFHGMFNAVAGLSIMAISGAENIFRGALGFSGIIAMGLIAAMGYILYRFREQYQKTLQHRNFPGETVEL